MDVTRCQHARQTSIAPILRRLIGLQVVVALACGCAYTGSVHDYLRNGFKVGPEYLKPAASIAPQWIDSYDKRVLTELPRNNAWWTVFNDPQLDSLIQQAYAGNIPLREAGMRVVEARAQVGIAVGSLFPQDQTAFGELRHIQISRTALDSRPLLASGVPRTFDRWSTGFDAGWELDFWGKFRRGIEATEAHMDATVESYDDVLVTLIAETAAAYVEYRTAHERIRLAKANVQAQQGSLSIAESRYKSGEADELDVFQAQTNVSNTEALIPELNQIARLAEIRLCVLRGVSPQDLTDELGTGPIPQANSDVAVGIPADLLRRRPDVREAERQVAEASAKIGVAAADLLPQLAIRGTIGYQSEDLGSLFQSSSNMGGVTPGFKWDILNYGRLANQVRVRDAQFQQRALHYQQTVLKANADVERSLSSFLQSQTRVQRLSEAVHANRQALNIALDQYQAGETNYNQIFTLQSFLVQEEDALAVARQRVATSLIGTYKAMGGGWQIRLASTTPAVDFPYEDLPAADAAEPIDDLPPIPGEELPDQTSQGNPIK